MLHHRLFATAALGVALLLSGTPLAQAQQGPGWFIPSQNHPQAGPRRAPSRPAAPTAAPAAAPEPAIGPEQAGAPAEQLPVQLPPAPPVPDVARGSLPPAAVIGVLSIPDVLRTSVAYQAADKLIAERRQKLNDDAQKEQVRLRDLGQALANDRAKMSAEQIRAKEKELQDRIAELRRSFTERNRVIQEQGQYALLQIQRTLTEVVQKVAASRGMNLVLQRAEVAVNIPEFDITSQVADVLNRALTSVSMPPEGVSPVSTPAVAAAEPTKKAAAAQKQP